MNLKYVKCLGLIAVLAAFGCKGEASLFEADVSIHAGTFSKASLAERCEAPGSNSSYQLVVIISNDACFECLQQELPRLKTLKDYMPVTYVFEENSSHANQLFRVGMSACPFYFDDSGFIKKRKFEVHLINRVSGLNEGHYEPQLGDSSLWLAYRDFVISKVTSL